MSQEQINKALGVIHHFPTEGNPVYMRQMEAPAGYVIGSHKHKYEHYSVLCSGSVRVDYDESTEFHTAPAVMTVPANTEHCITALTDITWLCIHGTSEIDNLDTVLITPRS